MYQVRNTVSGKFIGRVFSTSNEGLYEMLERMMSLISGCGCQQVEVVTIETGEVIQPQERMRLLYN